MGGIKEHGLDHPQGWKCTPGVYFPTRPNPSNSQIATTKTTTLSTLLVAAAVYRSQQLESPPFCPQAQCDDFCYLNFMFSREHLKPRDSSAEFLTPGRNPTLFRYRLEVHCQRCELVTWRTKRVEPELRRPEESLRLKLCVSCECQGSEDYRD
jgi:hypothetical protein